jgi:hypothetical protein
MEAILERFTWINELLPLIGYGVLTIIFIFLYHFVANQVKALFILRKQKKELFDDLYIKVEKLLDKVKSIVDSLTQHTEAIKDLEEGFAKKIQEVQNNSEKYTNRKIIFLTNRLSKLENKESEHFKTLKGSYDKQYEKIRDLQEDLSVLTNSHNHHHPDNKIQ